MGTPVAVLPDDDGRTHLIHQDDLARAFCEACFADHPGAYLIVTDESIAQEDLAELSGGRVVRVPVRPVEVALDAAHALRLSPVSADWAVSGDREARLGRARDGAGLGALDDLARVGPGAPRAAGSPALRYADGPPRHEVAERMLDVPTAWLRDAAAQLPGTRGRRPRRNARARSSTPGSSIGASGSISRCTRRPTRRRRWSSRTAWATTPGARRRWAARSPTPG